MKKLITVVSLIIGTVFMYAATADARTFKVIKPATKGALYGTMARGVRNAMNACTESPSSRTKMHHKTDATIKAAQTAAQKAKSATQKIRRNMEKMNEMAAKMKTLSQSIPNLQHPLQLRNLSNARDTGEIDFPRIIVPERLTILSGPQYKIYEIQRPQKFQLKNS